MKCFIIANAIIIFALLPSLGRSQIPNSHAYQCVVGDPQKLFYINNFESLKQQSESPLIQEYLRVKASIRFAKSFQRDVFSNIADPLQNDSIPISFTRFSKYLDGMKILTNKDWVSKSKLSCALKRVPNIKSQKALCESSDSIAEFLSENTEIPCINQEILDYIHFVLNQAFRCFDHKMDDYSREVLLRKINLESAFGFFFADKKGKGISQIVSDTAFEMNDPDFNGYKYLIEQFNKNPDKCSSFIEILKNNPNSERRMNTCGYVNLEDGLGRSVITGLGTYFYYRDDHPTISAEKLLSWLGVKNSSQSYYKEMRSVLALGMYNKGPGTVRDSIKFVFEKNELSYFNSKPHLAYKNFVNKIKNTNFYIYIQDSEDLYSRTYHPNGSCRI